MKIANPNPKASKIGQQLQPNLEANVFNTANYVVTLTPIYIMENSFALIIASFQNEQQAAEVVEKLKQRQKEKIINIWYGIVYRNLAVITRDKCGKLYLQIQHRRGINRSTSIISAIASGIVGIIAGAPVDSILLGAAAGTLSVKAIDLGFDDQKLKQISNFITPGSSAMIAIIKHNWVKELIDVLTAFGAKIIRQELKHEIAAAIAASTEY